MATSDDLWGAQLVTVSFDPVSHVCKLGAVAHVLAGTTHFLITCTSVSDFSFRSTIPEQWTYADVTEVYITPDEATGRQHLEIMLWSEDAGIDIRCRSIEIAAV